MSALDEVGRQGVPGYKHLRPALGESVEPGRRRTLMGGTAGRPSARDWCHRRSQSSTRGAPVCSYAGRRIGNKVVEVVAGAGSRPPEQDGLLIRMSMPPNLSAVSWTASATRSSSLMSTIRGSARAADLADLLGRSIDRAPSFACGSTVFAAAERSRRLALRAAQWQARCLRRDGESRCGCRPRLGKPDDDDRPVPGMWLDYGASVGHAGLVVERVNGRKLPNRLQPKPSEFATLR